MKNIKRLLLCLLITIFTFSAVACQNPSGNSGKESTGESESVSESVSESTTESESTPESVVESVSITMSIDKAEITVGETAKVTVTVTGSANTAYTFSFSEEGVIAIDDNGVLSIVSENLGYARSITVTATADADASKKASKSITVRPIAQSGKVHELTSEMIAAIGNPSITVTGVLTDEYTDFNQPLYSGTSKYDMLVYMEDGKWSGTWNRQVAGLGANPIKITDIYARSEDDGYEDAYGNYGHAMERVLINKNNEVERRTVKDYMSVPAVWEAQHLYNHLANLDINKFVYDSDNDVYEYVYDVNSEEDAYLLTYLSYSLTPLLSETLEKLYLVVEDGEIVKLLAQTPTVYSGTYYDENNQVHHDAMSITTVELEFSNVGTTVVPDPAPFVASQYNDVLKAALTEMASATNYTFHAVETSTYAPSGDYGDYEIMSLNARIGNNVSSTGVVGLLGQVTEDAILLANTGKYSYSMDGQDYHTTYTGYKDNGDGTYDHFAYDAKIPGFYGTKRVTGALTDVLPDFDFASEIFRFKSSYMSEAGVTYYEFVLRESAINRDVALQTSMHSYADDSLADAGKEFTITVTSDGHLYQVVYPYDLVSGTYLGYITTTYGLVGTTTLDDGLFDGYVQREVLDDWSDYHVKYYSSTVNGPHEDVTADVVLQGIFGDDFDKVPPVTVFTDIFGDNLNGPFFDWIVYDTDAEGNNLYRGKMNFNTSATEYDENAKITNLDEVFTALEEALSAHGFTKSLQNSGERYQNSYLCMINGNVQIYIENNGTKHMWIYFCYTGDWTLNR